MASAELPRTAGRDWVLANPWWWMGLGLGCCYLAWLWILVLGQDYPAGRFTLLTIGLLSAAAAVVLRLKLTQPSFLSVVSPSRRSQILMMLALLLGALALAVSILLVLAFMRPDSIPWSWGPLLVCWVVVAPMTQIAAVQSFRRSRLGEPLSQREEGAVLLLLAGLACYGATRALYDPEDVLYMDTIRLFLSVLTLTALAAAPLVLVPQDVRRKVISLLIVLHFAGIATTTLTATANSPRALKQLWDRIYRPYLQFFYITNAYHIYAPEPGPNSYMWFRILFVDAQGREVGRWLKIPELDDTAHHGHPTGLTYIRYSCIMHHGAPQESFPATAFYDLDGRPAKFYDNRLKRVPDKKNEKSAGEELQIPWNPQYTYPEQQFHRPGSDAQAVLRSFARHVLRYAEMPGCRVKGVKIYHVTHSFLTPEVYRSDLAAEPWDPHTYWAVYLGEYDSDGRLRDPDDPFLYWMIPTIRKTPQRDSIFECYIRRHAGDPAWIRNERGEWVGKE
jgi:hypothetical protein